MSKKGILKIKDSWDLREEDWREGESIIREKKMEKKKNAVFFPQRM